MIRHQAFFEFLAGSDQTSSAWQPVVAGIATLRLVDSRLDESGSEPDWASVESVKTAIGALREGDPVRAILFSLVEAASNKETRRAAVGNGLLAYGRALNFEGKWALVCDVYSAADQIAGAPANPDISIKANIGLGAAARQMAQWDKSANAYARATHIANAIGDHASVLSVDVRRATTLMLRGNLPEAEALMTETLKQARVSNYNDVIGLALHGRSAIAFHREDYADAVRFGYEALEEMGDSVERDGVLADLASAFGAMGINDAARDGYLIVSATAQSQWVRWQADINLMELAFIEGNEREFDKYLQALADAPLPPKLRASYHLFGGQGLQRFERDGRSWLEVAISIAEENQFHQVAHDARVALVDFQSQETARRRVEKRRSDIDPSVRWIVSELSSMRESVMSKA